MDPQGSDAEDLVYSKRGESVFLPRPDGAVLTIGTLEDTEYKDTPTVVNGWGKFYLPNITKMKVIGYVEGTSYPCDQLVLMTCEDQKVYGFDGDELHLVASKLDEMFTEGIADPALQSYYYGEAFKDMSEDDWEEVKQSPVGKMLDEEQRQLLQRSCQLIDSTGCSPPPPGSRGVSGCVEPTAELIGSPIVSSTNP